MKTTKKMIAVLLCLLLGILPMAGCAPVAAVGGAGEERAAASVAAVNAGNTHDAPDYNVPDSAAATAAAGANDFAFRLSAALVKDAGNSNFVISPYSVWIPLAALVNATDGRNKPALLKALNASGISEREINNAAWRMLYDLTRQRDKGSEWHRNPLQIANAVFVDNSETPNKNFAQIFADYYHGAVMNVDFMSPSAVTAVNKWANDNTDGLITEIVEEFDRDTVAAIANAIYFSDSWEVEFKAGQTKEGVFHAPGGDAKAFYMLREGDGLDYYEDDKVQAMPLRFGTGGGMYIILPKNGDAARLLSSMTSEYFDKIQKEQAPSTGKLLLPRFSLESDVIQLKDALMALGVPLFDAAAAPLTGGLIEGDAPVYLSSAVHKAVIEVDEKGATAAAVTVMVAERAMLPLPTKPFQMICDKPFVFILYDNTNDGGRQVLFTGVVNRP